MGIAVYGHIGGCCGYKTLSKHRDYDSDLYTAICKKDTERGKELELELYTSGLGYTYVIPKSIQDEKTLEHLIKLKEKYPNSKAVIVNDCIFFTTCESSPSKPYKGNSQLCLFARDIAGEPNGVMLFYRALPLMSEEAFKDMYRTISPAKLLSLATDRGYSIPKTCVESLLDPNLKAYATQTLDQYRSHGGFLESLGFEIALMSKNPNTSTQILLLVRGGFSAVEI